MGAKNVAVWQLGIGDNVRGGALINELPYHNMIE